MNDGTYCTVCGEVRATLWRTAPDNLVGGDTLYTAVKCLRCGLIRLEPRPDDATMNTAYAATTYARAEGESETTELGKRLDTFFVKQAERASEAFGGTSAGKLLDVGCGDGRFLAAMQLNGWTVEGLETDPVAAKLARRRTGATIHETYLENAPVAAETFDMVSLLHVLEHVPDPRETITAAHTLLKPGGMLLLALPNAASFEAEVFQSKWYPLDLPRHFWGFTPHTLLRLVEECNFMARPPRYFPFLFAPQSVRYLLKGAGTGSGASVGTRTEGGGLRTKIFNAILAVSEKAGYALPGEIMELTARKQ